MGRGAVVVWNWDGVMTLLRRLPPALYSLVSGCHVRRRQASSFELEMESRLDQPEVDAVGDDRRLPPFGERAAELEVFTTPGPKTGRPAAPWGDWNGLPAPEGTLSRRPGVRLPGA